MGSWIENELIELINSDQFRLSIPIQFQFKIFQFNSNSIHAELNWIDYQFQFNSWIDPSLVPGWGSCRRRSWSARFPWSARFLPSATRPKGGLFRYHVKRIHFTMQGFGFLSAILWWGKIDGHVLLLRKCRHYLISRDLIWIKIVAGKTIYKQIVIILVIWFAVLSTVFQLK